MIDTIVKWLYRAVACALMALAWALLIWLMVHLWVAIVFTVGVVVISFIVWAVGYLLLVGVHR